MNTSSCASRFGGHRVSVTLLIGMLALWGCAGPSFQVVDRTGLEIAVTSIRLDGGNDIHVLDGESERLIPLDKVEKITLDPKKTYSDQDRLYFQAVIVLSDGTHVKPRKSNAGEARAFMAVNRTISGTSAAGPVEIRMEDVNVMRRLVKPPTANTGP